MANDGNNSRVRRMNLNLYPVPPSPPHMSSNPRFDSYLRYSLNQTLYNPVSQSNEPVLQIDDDPYVPESPSHASYCPYSPLYSPPVSPSRYSPSSPASVEIGEPLVQDNDPYIPYSPSNVLNPQTPNFPTHGRDEYSPVEPSVQIDRYPEANFPRWRGFMRRLGPAVLNRLNSNSGFRRRDSSSAGLISRATNSPRAETRENAIPIGQDRVYDIGDRSIEISDTYEGNAPEVVAEYLHKGMKGQSNGVANFECNVCLDMAKEPVVTLCGHLFCWPCLYQWLHLHSDTKECPVCKGEVTDSNIIPIYGRGSPANQAEINHDEEEGSSSKVPPRPHGHRIESLRQRIHRSFPRRLVDEIRSWRRNADNETQNGNRMEGHGERNGRENFDSASRRSPARLRLARWLQRENSEQGLNLFDDSHVDGGLDGGSRGSSVVRDRANVWRQLTLNRLQTSERLEAIRASISNVESILARFDRITSRRNRSTPSTSVNHQDPELLHDQDSQRPMTAMDRASVSSTSAVIEGDIGALNTSVGPNALGFSPTLRRRRRNGGASSSFDVDGEVHHAQKRRRSN